MICQSNALIEPKASLTESLLVLLPHIDTLSSCLSVRKKFGHCMLITR